MMLHHRSEEGMNSTSWPNTIWNVDGERADTAMTSYDVNIGPLSAGFDLRRQKLALWEFDWIFNVVIIVLMVTSFLGNIAVIYLICTQKKSRTAQSISIVSVCVAAILVASFVMPTYLVVTSYQADHLEQTCTFLCKLQVYVWYWCKTVIAYSICALVCDRYSLATQPTKRHAPSGRYMFFLSFVWFFGASYNIWDIIIALSRYVDVTTPGGQNATLRRCVTSARFSYIQNGVFYSDMLVIYVIPAAVICYMYGVIIYYQCFKLDTPHQNINKRKLMLSIAFLAAFYVCQLPLEVMDAWGFFSSTETFKLMLIRKITELVSFAHGFLNVIIYAFFSSDLQILFRRKCSNNRALGPYQRVMSPAAEARANGRKRGVCGQGQTSLEMTAVVIEGEV